MKITKIEKKGIDVIKFFEGFKARPYLCPAGVWTIGYGTTFYFDTKKRVKPTDAPISEAEAERLLIGHVNSIFAPIVDRLCRDDINQNQFDALCSFVYNTGGGYTDRKGKFQYYDLFENVNERMPREELTEYWLKCAVTANKKPLKGLVNRRKKEVELYFL